MILESVLMASYQLVAALMPAIEVGAAVGLAAGSSVDDIWNLARQYRTTVLVAYPLTLSDVVNAPQAAESDIPFRVALSGGSSLAPRIKRDFRERMGVPLLESYGQSELGGYCNACFTGVYPFEGVPVDLESKERFAGIVGHG